MVDDVVTIHEAAHVFMATVLGLAVRSVQVGNDPRFEFAAAPGPIHRLDHARVLMAGCEAARIVFDCAIGGGSDDEQFADMLTDADDEAVLRDKCAASSRSTPVRYATLPASCYGMAH